jgi:hypothetical protein
MATVAAATEMLHARMSRLETMMKEISIPTPELATVGTVKEHAGEPKKHSKQG